MASVLARNTKLQTFICECPDGSNIIVKHVTCPDKCKTSVFLAGTSGKAFVYHWRATHAKVGKKILLSSPESLGGQQLKMFEMQSYCAPQFKMFEMQSGPTAPPNPPAINLGRRRMRKSMPASTSSSSMRCAPLQRCNSFGG